MPKYSDFAAAIFDMDDTLIDNYPPGHPDGLHEESRLLAIRDVGKRHNVPELLAFTTEENVIAFRDAPVHSLEGAVWNVLTMCGLVNGDAIDTMHPLFREIVDLKEKWHEQALRDYAIEVPGAAKFVRLLAKNGFQDRMGIASTAFRRDIFLSLEILGLQDLFPDERVISKDRFTHAKPHPEAFEKALAALGLHLPPEKVLAFEDDPRGIMSAKAAGLFTCAIATRYTKKELAAKPVPPDLIADSYAEFEVLLGL
jgi:HAD superfamily hydrolase (TIGR01509 family)